ncbi:MAG: MFS transporter, partial [Actinobacteria bacterium]|nr:MFS transporter [Actinomycetota bacterium]
MTTTTTKPGSGPASAARPRGGRWAPLAVTLTAPFMMVLDFFIVNVAIPGMQRDLHASAAGIEWIVAAYGIPFGTVLITGGRLGDLYGRRRVLMLGLAIFTAASLACGMAPSAAVLIAGRVLQGIGGAIAGPQALALVTLGYSGRDRVRATTAYGLVLGAAAVFGQLIGGALIQADIAGLGWRACFLVNVPVGAAAIALARVLVPELRSSGRERLDLAGTALVSAALVALVFPLTQGRQEGWPAWSWACLGGSVPLLALFVAHQRWRRARGRAPLIDPALFADRGLSVGVATALVFQSAMASFFLVLALYLQDGRGLPALGSGLVFVAVGGGYLATSLLSPRLLGRLGRQVPALGGLLMAAGLLALKLTVTMTGTGGSTALLWPALLATGLGMGMVLTPLVSVTLAAVRPRHAGAASGVQATGTNLGNAIGVAVIGVVFFAAVRGGYA